LNCWGFKVYFIIFIDKVETELKFREETLSNEEYELRMSKLEGEILELTRHHDEDKGMFYFSII